MAPSARLCLGKGAHCSCLVKFIRPPKDVAAALVNPDPGRCIDDLIAISRDVTTRGRKMFVSIFFRSSTIPSLLHAAERWSKVEEQGPPDQLWEDAAPTEAPAAAVYIDERVITPFWTRIACTHDTSKLVEILSFFFISIQVDFDLWTCNLCSGIPCPDRYDFIICHGTLVNIKSLLNVIFCT